MGALGPVFRTYEPTRDRLVAVKVFRLDITPEQAQALADELSRAAEASLFHPSIVEPIAAGVEGTVAYRAEEYVAAESLDVAMRHYAPAALDRALPFITQLAGAIDFARAAGVGHGALHPRDIFVTPDEARATGFGIVEPFERVGLRAPVRRPYTAPERIAGGSWNTTADVFSLAAIAYELLTGRRPAGAGEGIGSITGANLTPHAIAIHEVLARAMHEDPARRYTTALAFASALEAASRGERDTGAETHGAAIPVVPPRQTPREGQPGEPLASDRFSPATESLAADSTGLAARESRSEDLDLIVGDAGAAVAGDTLVIRDRSSLPTAETDGIRERASAPDTGAIPGPPLSSVGDEDTIPAHPRSSADDEETIPARSRPSADDEATIPLHPRASADDEETLPQHPHQAGADEETIPQYPGRFPGDEDTIPVHPRRSAGDEETIPMPPRASVASGDALRESPRGLAADESAIHEFSRASAADEGVILEHPRASAGDGEVIGEHPRASAAADEEVIRDYRGVATGDEVLRGDQRRAAVLPLALMLIFGLLLGFAAGYAVGGRDRGGAPFEQAPQASAAGAPAAQPSGRAWSEQAVKPPATAAQQPSPTAPPVAGDVAAGSPKPAARGPASAPPPARLDAGTLVVRSTPSGAGVTLNGRWRGRTPLTLEGLPFARYVVRIVQPGYVVARDEIALSRGNASRAMSFALRPQAAAARRPADRGTAAAREPAAPRVYTGSVFVASNPSGARVFLDGKPVGTAPLRIPEVPIGAHVVRMELPDHRTWSAATRVVAGQDARVTGSLERIQ